MLVVQFHALLEEGDRPHLLCRAFTLGEPRIPLTLQGPRGRNKGASTQAFPAKQPVAGWSQKVPPFALWNFLSAVGLK